MGVKEVSHDYCHASTLTAFVISLEMSQGNPVAQASAFSFAYRLIPNSLHFILPSV